MALPPGRNTIFPDVLQDVNVANFVADDPLDDDGVNAAVAIEVIADNVPRVKFEPDPQLQADVHNAAVRLVHQQGIPLAAFAPRKPHSEEPKPSPVHLTKPFMSPGTENWGIPIAAHIGVPEPCSAPTGTSSKKRRLRARR